MADGSGGRPAFSRETGVLRLGSVSSRLDDITADWAGGGSTGAGVRIAVVDRGVEADPPALDGCVDVDGGIEVVVDDTGTVTERAGRHDDAFGHGTACAGIVHGLAPDAVVTSVKVLGGTNAGKGQAFLRGLAWAVEQRFDVINLSLGSTKRDWALPLHDVCDAAYFAGCFVVTAANNVARPSFPSLYSSVPSVAVSTATDPMRFHYNPDPPTEFLAPGLDVDVAWKGGGRVVATGNSYAAPHISGIAALVKAKHPELRPFQLKTVLWATAANVTEAPGDGAASPATFGSGNGPYAGRVSNISSGTRGSAGILVTLPL